MYIVLLHITTDDYLILLHFSISLLHITTIRDITTITSYYYTIHYYTILHHYYSLLVNTLSLLNSKFWEKLLLDYFHYYIISITTKHNYYVLLLLLPLLIPPTWRCASRTSSLVQQPWRVSVAPSDHSSLLLNTVFLCLCP